MVKSRWCHFAPRWESVNRTASGLHDAALLAFVRFHEAVGLAVGSSPRRDGGSRRVVNETLELWKRHVGRIAQRRLVYVSQDGTVEPHDESNNEDVEAWSFTRLVCVWQLRGCLGWPVGEL